MVLQDIEGILYYVSCRDVKWGAAEQNYGLVGA